MPVRFRIDPQKTIVAMTYLVSKELPQMDKYKLAKLLFLADKRHLVEYGRPVTGDRYCAVKLGPIPSNGLNILTALEVGKGPLAQFVTVDKSYVYPRYSVKQRLDC